MFPTTCYLIALKAIAVTFQKQNQSTKDSVKFLLYSVTKCILWLKLDVECKCKWGATCQLDIIMYMYVYI